MKSLKYPVQGTFFGKSIREHQEVVAKAIGLSWWQIRVRYLSYDTGAEEATIFYEVEEEVEEDVD